jgi:hypothetical protein
MISTTSLFVTVCLFGGDYQIHRETFRSSLAFDVIILFQGGVIPLSLAWHEGKHNDMRCGQNTFGTDNP